MIRIQTLYRLVLFVLLLVPLSSEPANAQQAEADVLLTQATLAYDDRQYDKALNLLNRVLVLEPHNARASYYKGLVFQAQQKPELAVQAFETAHSIQPRDLFTRYQLGATYFLLEGLRQSRPAYLGGLYRATEFGWRRLL